MSVVRAALAFLDSVAEEYPTGVPKAEASQGAPRVPRKSMTEVPVAFVTGDLSAEERALLEAAVTKGMKLSLAACAIIAPETVNEVTAKVFIELGVRSSAQNPIRTVSLKEVLSDPSKKRVLWDALKEALTRIS